MICPKVTLQLNKGLDKWAALEFVKEDRSSFIDKYYKDNNDILKEALDKIQTNWDQICNDYFQEVGKIFGTSFLKDVEYVGYLSIFNFNPRFLETGDFQFYYMHPEGTNYCIAHEVLHFIFYDFIKRFSFKDQEKLWNLSEILNVVILSLPSIASLTKNPKPQPYKEHGKID